MNKKLVFSIFAFFLVLITHAVYSIWKAEQLSKQWAFAESQNYLQIYFSQQDYLLGLSYAIVAVFTICALFHYIENRKCGTAAIFSGVTLSGILYFTGCFLIGCCGSPMLTIYLSLFGSSFLGFTKLIVFIITCVSVAIGAYWLYKKHTSCCNDAKVKKHVKK